MKNTQTILSHLTSLPHFKVLKRHECYQKYIKLLGAKFQKAIAFVYIKEKTLYVALTHPGFKMEINYNQTLLKEILVQFAKYVPECNTLKADKIIIFHSKYYPASPQEAPKSVPFYSELATGEFLLCVDDSEIKTRFEKIRDTIKRNQ